MTIERRFIRQNGVFRVFWVALDDKKNIVKISRKPLDKDGKVCYNKDTKTKGNDTNGN